MKAAETMKLIRVYDVLAKQLEISWQQEVERNGLNKKAEKQMLLLKAKILEARDRVCEACFQEPVEGRIQ